MTSSTPLIPKDAAAAAAAPPPPLARTAARAGGLSRALFGAACILFPTATMRLFSLDTPGAGLAVGFSGVRDLVLGELLLLSAGAAQTEPAARGAVRRVLWGIVAVDVLDLCVAGAAVARGEIGWVGFGWVAGLAAASGALAGEALWGY